MRTVLVALVGARLEATSRTLHEAGFSACVVPATVRIPDGATCAEMTAQGAAPGAALDLALGEAEHVQLLVEAHGVSGPVELSAPPVPVLPQVSREEAQPSVEFTWNQVGYVHLERTRRYEASTRSGYWPDPLLAGAT